MVCIVKSNVAVFFLLLKTKTEICNLVSLSVNKCHCKKKKVTLGRFSLLRVNLEINIQRNAW